MGLTQLRELSVFGSRVTPDGLAAIRKALPNCNITN
jgi:hypothetical protein